MKGRGAIVLCLLLVSLSAGQSTADLILINGNVRTIDPRNPRAEAVAISHGRIMSVGRTADIRALAGPDTRVIDAGKRLVIPGFNDAHVHFTAIGNQFTHIVLKDAANSVDVARRIRRHMKFLPKGRWLIGSGLRTVDAPALDQLDAASAHNPVLLYFVDPASAMVNSSALTLGRVSSTAATMSGIQYDMAGQPSGVVTGRGLRLIRGLVPADHAANWAEIAETASNYAASLGVTSVQDVHSDDLAGTLRSLAQRGSLKNRIYECIGIRDWKKLTARGVKAASGSEMVREGCVKGTADGSGDEINELRQAVANADKAGLQVMVHAIGERAIENTLGAFEYVAATNGRRDRRFRIEHAHRIRRSHLSRLSRSAIIPSMQPYLFYNGTTAEGDDFKTLLGFGTNIAFGSDASMIDLDPLLGIYAAVNSGTRSISVKEAVTAYTLGSAYAEYQEKIKGSIQTGMLADLIILSEDIFSIDPAKLNRARVLMTVMNGKVVYESE